MLPIFRHKDSSVNGRTDTGRGIQNRFRCGHVRSSERGSTMNFGVFWFCNEIEVINNSTDDP
jgi:hypothetical protein